jgi:hypothetical protein
MQEQVRRLSLMASSDRFTARLGGKTMNIVIAYDGSEQAKAAIDDLRRAGMPRSINALVVSVGETLLPTTALPIVDITQGAMSHRIAGTGPSTRGVGSGARRDESARTDASRRIHQKFPHWGVYIETNDRNRR